MQDKEVIVFGRWAMTKINKVCPKHGEQMYAVGPNQVEVCQACGKESIERDEQKTQLEFVHRKCRIEKCDSWEFRGNNH